MSIQHDQGGASFLDAAQRVEVAWPKVSISEDFTLREGRCNVLSLGKGSDEGLSRYTELYA